MSEVLGTILVLLITVIIFSSIVLWVFTLPAPRAAGNSGIDGGLEGRYVAGSWAGAYVNLTHLGGDDLLDTNTRVFLTIDGQTHALRTQGTHFDGVSVKPYGVDGDVQWTIGETWTYENETIPQSAEISVLVVDVTRGTVVWDQVLLGEGGERLPVFLDKWFDSVPSSPSRDPVLVNDTFAMYARVGDPDGDLNPASVWGYITFGYGVPLGYVQLLDNGDPAVGDAVAGDGVFSRSLSFAALPSWDGGIVVLNATDDEGHVTGTRLILGIAKAGPQGPQGPQGPRGRIEGDFWEFIGTNQLDLDDIFWTLGGEGASPTHWHPVYRIVKGHTDPGGMIWHMVINNHGNRTFFPDGYSGIQLTIQGSDKFFHLMKNDTDAYTVDTANPNSFWYDKDYVLDVNLDDQQLGGKKLDYKFSTDTPGGSAFQPIGVGDATAWVFVSITGTLGPLNKTLQQIADQYCGGGAVQPACYNPADYLYDGTEWETKWAGGLIPFISLYVFSSGTGPSCGWPPPEPVWYGGSDSCP